MIKETLIVTALFTLVISGALTPEIKVMSSKHVVEKQGLMFKILKTGTRKGVTKQVLIEEAKELIEGTSVRCLIITNEQIDRKTGDFSISFEAVQRCK